MGVQGLTKVVNAQPGLLQDERFCARSLVIDGSNLIYHLYFDSGLDQNHGGEYDAFKDRVTEFIVALRKCGVRPYLVFDGCADFAEQKRGEEKSRAEQRVRKANKAAESGKNMGVLPTLIWEVFRQTLQTLGVCMARSYTEADREAAALAHDWDCPVLSNDSDFFVFPSRGGMLPTSHFRWQHLREYNGQSFIPCKMFRFSRFCEVFSITPQMLPVFAVLAGNDYTKNMALVGHGQRQMSLHTILQDLKRMSRHKDPGPLQAFEEFVKTVPQNDRKQAVSTLLQIADNYSLPRSSLSSYFRQRTLPPLPPQMEGVIPDWMKAPLIETRFTLDFLDVLTYQRVGLSVVVDHWTKPSANQVSLPLRRVLYGLLLGPDREVEERDRDGLKVIYTRVKTEATPLSLQSLPEASEEQRRQVLLEALGVNEHSALPSHLTGLDLPLAATCFWLKEATPPLNLLKALLIGWCKGDTIKKNADVKPPLDLDLDVCHWLNQWQSCLRDAFILNQLLLAPLPEPHMERLFSGTLVHGLIHKMKSGLLDQSLQSYIKHDKDINALLHIAQQSQSGSGDQGSTAAAETVSGQASKMPEESNTNQRKLKTHE